MDVSKLNDDELAALALTVVAEQSKRLAVANAGISRPAVAPEIAVAAKPNMSINEVAKALSVSVSTIQRRVRDDKSFPKPLHHKRRSALRWRASDIASLRMLVDAEHVAGVLLRLNVDDDSQGASNLDEMLHERSTEES